MESRVQLSAQAALIPRITSVSPPLVSNLGGASLTIAGRNFSRGWQVLVAGSQWLCLGPVVEPASASVTAGEVPCHRSGGGQGGQSRRPSQ